ncbi:MAG TPA: hypothetical protein VMW01_04295 [Williamwhitmania sp.]|jgi:hypothetical protein|nr:hypothetical protein [Williamwhitmania sp.]
MKGLFTRSASKRKPFRLKFEDLNYQITPEDKLILSRLEETFDALIIKLEEFAYSGNSRIQIHLRNEKVIDLARAELLLLTVRYFDPVAAKANFSRDAGIFFTSNLAEYILSLRIKFPQGWFKDFQSFYRARFNDYVQFWNNFNSKDPEIVKNSLFWLESIISLRLFGEIKINEIEGIYYPDFDALNQAVFMVFFLEALIQFKINLSACFD